MSVDILEFQKMVVNHRNQRKWKKFHTPKDEVISMVLEVAEVLEHFQWKNDQELKSYIKNHKKEIGYELMDVFYWILLMSHDFKIDIEEVFKEKMKENEKKYPIKKSKNSHKKYTEY